MSIIGGILETAFIILLACFGIWALMLPTNQIPVSEKIIPLFSIGFIQIIYWGSLLSLNVPGWVPMLLFISLILLVFTRGLWGNCIDNIYNTIIKPYKKYYLTIAKGGLFLLGLFAFFAAYYIAFQTFNGHMNPAVNTARFSVIFMLIAGLLSGSSGLCGMIWHQIMKGRSNGEKQIVIPGVTFLIWIVFLSFFSHHLTFASACVASFLVVLYFAIAIKGYKEDGSERIAFAPFFSIIHFASLIGIITLFLYNTSIL